MRIARWWLAAALALPLAAGAQVSVHVQVPGVVMLAPPQPRLEPMPPPRGGYAWVPGHWAWGGDAYAWRPGQWVAQRPEHAYVPGRWVQAEGGWRWVEGDWKPHKKHKKRKHDDWDERDDDRGRGDYHCPPGQAKKGRC